jgi:hypothetical protein
MLQIGKIYRLRFPGIAVRVIKPPPGQAPSGFPYLVESLFLKSRWYVNARGEPAYPDAPRVIVPSVGRQPAATAVFAHALNACGKARRLDPESWRPGEAASRRDDATAPLELTGSDRIRRRL